MAIDPDRRNRRRPGFVQTTPDLTVIGVAADAPGLAARLSGNPDVAGITTRDDQLFVTMTEKPTMDAEIAAAARVSSLVYPTPAAAPALDVALSIPATVVVAPSKVLP